jgi:hypothetical protein
MRRLRGYGAAAMTLAALCLMLTPWTAEAQWSAASVDAWGEARLAIPMAGAPDLGLPQDLKWGVAPALEVQQQGEAGSGWRKGLWVGGLIGGAVGLLAFLAVDSLPCDSCSGVSDSFASGTGPEFVLGFALVGAGVGALVAR